VFVVDKYGEEHRETYRFPLVQVPGGVSFCSQGAQKEKACMYSCGSQVTTQHGEGLHRFVRENFHRKMASKTTADRTHVHLAVNILTFMRKTPYFPANLSSAIEAKQKGAPRRSQRTCTPGKPRASPTPKPNSWVWLGSAPTAGLSST